MPDVGPRTCNGEAIPHGAPVVALRAAAEASGAGRWAAVHALAQDPSPEALMALVDLARSADPHLRRAAIEGIGMHACGESRPEPVLRGLRDPVGFIARTSLAAAAHLRLAEAHDPVLSRLGDEEAATRCAALGALEVLWQGGDFEAVFGRYLDDPSDEVRRRAAWTLRANVGPAHRERVILAWWRDGLPRHRAWACELAGADAGPAATRVLSDLLGDRDGHVRAAAARALERLHPV